MLYCYSPPQTQRRSPVTNSTNFPPQQFLAPGCTFPNLPSTRWFFHPRRCPHQFLMANCLATETGIFAVNPSLSIKCVARGVGFFRIGTEYSSASTSSNIAGLGSTNPSDVIIKRAILFLSGSSGTWCRWFVPALELGRQRRSAGASKHFVLYASAHPIFPIPFCAASPRFYACGRHDAIESESYHSPSYFSFRYCSYFLFVCCFVVYPFAGIRSFNCMRIIFACFRQIPCVIFGPVTPG